MIKVPAGTGQFKWEPLQVVGSSVEPVEFVRALVSMEDGQVSFQILCPSDVFRLPLLRIVPPHITRQATAGYDALVEWALASIIADGGVAVAGRSIPEEVAHDPSVCKNQIYLRHGALRQTFITIQEHGLGLTSSNAIKSATYSGCYTFVSWDA